MTISLAAIRIWSFIALCSLLASNLPRMAEAASSSSHQNEHKQGKKSLAGWVQSYKEPKSNEQPPAQNEQQKEMAPAEEEEEELSCTIKVQKVEKHTGKCVRLRGGSMACQTSTYLDPVNADCMFLDE